MDRPDDLSVLNPNKPHPLMDGPVPDGGRPQPPPEGEEHESEPASEESADSETSE